MKAALRPTALSRRSAMPDARVSRLLPPSFAASASPWTCSGRSRWSVCSCPWASTWTGLSSLPRKDPGMYSSRIAHLRLAPKNIDYWWIIPSSVRDDAVARVLQRFEYWDGTKAGGNVHGEETNEQLQAANQPPTQDVSRYTYKTVEELAWELLGSVSERSLPKILDTLCDQFGYLKRRDNPYSTFDHTKQYEFQESLVVAHLKRLAAIVEYFLDLGRRVTPVLYAIEQVTGKGIPVAHLIRQADGTFVEDESHLILSIERVAAALRSLHAQMHADAGKKKPTLPRFVRSALAKDEQRGFSATSDTPQGPVPPPDEEPSASSSAPPHPSVSTPPHDASRSGNFAETNPAPSAPSFRQNCRNGAAHSPEQRGSSAETIPFITSVIPSLTTAAVASGENCRRRCTHDTAAAAGVFSELGTLTADEIALVLAHRHQGRSQAVEAHRTGRARGRARDRCRRVPDTSPAPGRRASHAARFRQAACRARTRGDRDDAHPANTCRARCNASARGLMRATHRRRARLRPRSSWRPSLPVRRPARRENSAPIS